MKVIFALLFLFSCVDQNIKTPEGVLKKYVEGRFKGKKVESLKDYVSDNYFESQQSIRDTKYDDLDYIKKKRFKFISKNCSEVNCKITYYISYASYEGKTKDTDTDTKKIATLIPSGETWVIDSIDHIKTFHDINQKIEVIGN